MLETKVSGTLSVRSLTIVPAYDLPLGSKPRVGLPRLTRRKAPLASADISEKPIRPTAPFKSPDGRLWGPDILTVLLDINISCTFYMPYLTMAPKIIPGANPFVDPDHISDNTEYDEGSTLPVGRDASLTLATDSLIVLGRQQRLHLMVLSRS